MNTEQQNNNVSEVNEGVEVESTAEVKQETPKEKLYSKDEVEQMITKRLAKERRKQEEANKLAQMSADERAEYEYSSKLTKLSEKEQELNKREAEFNKRAMLNQTEKELLSRNLPVDFANLLVREDAESTKANIDAFNKQWNDALAKAVDAKIQLASKEPRVSQPKAQSRRDAKKMTLAERAHLKATNPEEFNKLFKK